MGWTLTSKTTPPFSVARSTPPKGRPNDRVAAARSYRRPRPDVPAEPFESIQRRIQIRPAQRDRLHVGNAVPAEAVNGAPFAGGIGHEVPGVDRQRRCPVRSSMAFSSGTRLPSPEPWSVMRTTTPVLIRYPAPPRCDTDRFPRRPAAVTTARLTSEITSSRTEGPPCIVLLGRVTVCR